MAIFLTDRAAEGWLTTVDKKKASKALLETDN